MKYEVPSPNDHCRMRLFGVPADCYVDGKFGYLITEPDTFPVFYRFEALDGKTFASPDLEFFECQCIHISECDWHDEEKVRERVKIAHSMRKAHGRAYIVLHNQASYIERHPESLLGGERKAEEKRAEPSGNIDASCFDPFQDKDAKNDAKSPDAGHRKRGIFFGITFGRG